MKKKKILIISIILVLVITVTTLIILSILKDENRLSVEEKQWLNDNKSNVINVNVINDLNIFGKDGKGVYFDFLNSLSEEYNIQINPVSFTTSDAVTGTSFGYSLTLDNFTSFYEDEFVLLSKEKETVNSLDLLRNHKVGITTRFKDYIIPYLNKDDIEYVEFATKEEIMNSFVETPDLNYIIVPKIMYLNEILSRNLHIIYNLSDANIYYGINTDNSELSNILSKYYATYDKEEFNKMLNSHELDLFVESLNLPSADVDALQANSYTYGFVNNGPYEIMSGGTFGGIDAASLKKFADLVNIKIDFIKYSNHEKLADAVANDKVNMYFDYYNLKSDYESVPANSIIKLTILAEQSDSKAINSLTSLNNKAIYVEANTKLYNYLKANTKFDLKTYKDEKELKKVAKEKALIAMDLNKYSIYRNNILSTYSIRYQENIKEYYNYMVRTNGTFTELFRKYLEILDNNQMRYIGLNNYFSTKQSGTLLGTLTKYILILLTIFIIMSLVVYKKGKKIKIARKIKKEDKMRFIDQLTSLKNRNYLTENIDNWNKNTVYPQAVIVLDLNRVQEINDTLGYEQGDEQIKAAANVLVKTQLDNTDIIRTDGNEFAIYLIGYEVKQITSYIHKLNKEFKKLPFDYGVAIGYSMITDDVKNVEDAINEAVEQVKSQKEEQKDESKS